MTIGQRIAQKRKELGLTQEALGDQLGVSRQSIYKWESDTALPEIDKLIALSRLFGVSVGWLLGVEEQLRTDGTGNGDAPEAEPGELTEHQLHMVEEIVQRYTAALPKAKRRRRTRVLAGILLFFYSFNLCSELNARRNQQHRTADSIDQVQNSVDRQIGSISSRVEEILKAQNSLVADAGVELVAGDPCRTGTPVRRCSPPTRLFPRRIPEGMTGGVLTWTTAPAASRPLPGTPCLRSAGPSRADSLACGLTDEHSACRRCSPAPDGTRSTQLLDQFDGLYGGTLPSARVMEYGPGSILGLEANSSGLLTLPEHWVTVSTSSPRTASEGQILPQAGAETVQVGLFKNKALVTWLEPAEKAGELPRRFRGRGLLPPAGGAAGHHDQPQHGSALLCRRGDRCVWPPGGVLQYSLCAGRRCPDLGRRRGSQRCVPRRLAVRQLTVWNVLEEN